MTCSLLYHRTSKKRSELTKLVLASRFPKVPDGTRVDACAVLLMFPNPVQISSTYLTLPSACGVPPFCHVFRPPPVVIVTGGNDIRRFDGDLPPTSTSSPFATRRAPDVTPNPSLRCDQEQCHPEPTALQTASTHEPRCWCYSTEGLASATCPSSKQYS